MTGALDYRTFADLKVDVQDIVSDDSEVTERMIEAALNRRLAEISAAIEFPELQTAEQTGLRLTSDSDATSLIAGDAFFPLPWNCSRVKSLHFQATGYGPLELVEASELFQRAGASLADAGKPCYAAVIGETAQYKRLPQAESVSVMTGTGATDNDGTKTVRVYYERSSTYPDVENWQDVSGQFSDGITLSSECAAGYPIKRVSLPPEWVGGLTMAGVTTATTVVALRNVELPGTSTNQLAQVARRLLLRVWPVPDVNYKLTTVYLRRPARMTEAEDVPAIPVSGWLIEVVAGDILRAAGKGMQASMHARTASELAAAITARHKHVERTVLAPQGGDFSGAASFGRWSGGGGVYY